MGFKKPLLKRYVSEFDCFLQELDRSPGAMSDSRRAEEAKHERIRRLRDHRSAEDLSLGIDP